MDPANVAYLREGLRGSSLEPRLHDLMLLFLKTHGNGYDISLLDAQRGISETRKFWLAVQGLNKMFLEVVKDHLYDSSDAAIGKYGYAEAMFIATEMRPPCYETLNDEEFIGNYTAEQGSYNGSSTCTRSPFDRPFDRYRSAVMRHQTAIGKMREDTGNVYGIDTRISDPLPGLPSAPSAGFVSRPSPTRITADMDDWELNKRLVQASINDQTYPEDMTDLYQKVSPNPNGEENYQFGSDILDELVDSKGMLISHYQSDEGKRQGHIARYGTNKYNDGIFPWKQNLSKRNYERKGDRDDDLLDGTLDESQQRSTRGWKAREVPKGEGGYRYRSIYPTSPSDDRKGSTFEPDPKVTWNRELGYKLRPISTASMLSARSF